MILNQLTLKAGQRLEQRGNHFVIVDSLGRVVDTNETQPASKYRNTKMEYNGIKFDSKKEAQRYAELLLMEKNGEITDLKRQVKFVLIPTQREEDIIGPKGGVQKGKLLETECSYYADFTYITADGEYVVEDVKSSFTQKDKVFTIKKKLMLYVHGITIKIYD